MGWVRGNYLEKVGYIGGYEGEDFRFWFQFSLDSEDSVGIGGGDRELQKFSVVQMSLLVFLEVLSVRRRQVVL